MAPSLEVEMGYVCAWSCHGALCLYWYDGYVVEKVAPVRESYCIVVELKDVWCMISSSHGSMGAKIEA